jgi:hypothetical protein
MYYNTTTNTVRIAISNTPTWVDLGGGANTALSNLTPTSINQSLVPGTANSFALGTSALPWSDLEVGTATFQGGAVYIDPTNGGQLWTNFISGLDSDELISMSNATGIEMKADNGVNLFGNSTGVSGSMHIFQASGGGTNYIGLTVSPTLGATTTYTLPSDGLSGQVLTTNGSGVLSWSSATSGANQSLSNLTNPTSVNQALIPSGAGTLNLGTQTDYWNQLYVSSIYDNINVKSIDVINRILDDSSGIESVQWGTRSLWAQLGPTEVMSWGNSGVTMNIAMLLNGSTSGALTQKAFATTTSYTITWPAAQAEGTLKNDGAGNLSWQSGGGSPTVQYYTVTSTDITNGYMTLSGTPAVAASTLLDVIGGSAQAYTTDYTVSGAQLTWTGTLASTIASGDVLRIVYWT